MKNILSKTKTAIILLIVTILLVGSYIWIVANPVTYGMKYRNETEDYHCVTVEDDGVGFDTNVLLDERKHVGIRNIRGRLKAMVNGTLEIESTIGTGTKVLITIPKGDGK